MSSLFVPWTPQRPAARGRVPVSARHLPRSARLWLIGFALVPLLTTGCSMYGGPSRVWELTPSTFNSFVARSEQPVLVNFYKPG